MSVSPDHAGLRARALVLVALLAPCLGGSTAPWAFGTLLAATGAVLLFLPPRTSPGRLWLALAGTLLACSLATFLPARWWPLLSWRATAIQLGVPLPATVTPQPWASVEGIGYLAGAIAFFLALAAHRWERADHQRATRWYAIAIIVLAAVALASSRGGWRVPWWPEPGNSTNGFGFFPNRNQSANVLALGGLAVLGLAFAYLRRRRWTGLWWCGGLIIIGAALVQSHSRAGVLLLLAGAGVWVLFPLRFSSQRKGVTLAAAAVLLLLTLFLLFGGRTLQRLQERHLGESTRLILQKHALRVATAQPWIGHGAGNFEPIFAITREPGPEQNRALHPESDWCWAAVELGWPAVAVLAAGLLLWLRQSAPFDSGSDRYLRSAAAVAAAAFAAHGLADVSGHRAGALWPALLLLALARHPRHQPAEPSPGTAIGFRLAGLLLVALGGWGIFAALQPARSLAWPTTSTTAWLAREADAALATNRPADALNSVTTGIRLRPLDWSFHYQHGVALLGSGADFQLAVSAFDRARFLEPRHAELTMQEGRLWLQFGEINLALDAWRETLRRAGPQAGGFFFQMLSAAGRRTALREGLAELARRDPAVFVLFLGNATPFEVSLEISRLQQEDPELTRFSAPQRAAVLQIWARSSEADALLEAVATRPEWLAQSWPAIAGIFARRQEFERAWRFLTTHGTRPVIPLITTGKTNTEMERSFSRDQNVLDGLALFTSLRNLRQNDEAFALLRTIASLPGRPAYVGYLLAEMHAERGEWQAAWEAWQSYQTSTPP